MYKGRIRCVCRGGGGARGVIRSKNQNEALQTATNYWQWPYCIQENIGPCFIFVLDMWYIRPDLDLQSKNHLEPPFIKKVDLSSGVLILHETSAWITLIDLHHSELSLCSTSHISTIINSIFDCIISKNFVHDSHKIVGYVLVYSYIYKYIALQADDINSLN